MPAVPDLNAGMISRNRALFALLLSLLLVAMQLRAQAHAIEHVGETLRHSADHSLLAPLPDTCATCVLLAGGANAISGDACESRFAVDGFEAVPCASPSFAPACPCYYSSRAPPSLL